jgi:hypothetical protein
MCLLYVAISDASKELPVPYRGNGTGRGIGDFNPVAQFLNFNFANLEEFRKELLFAVVLFLKFCSEF